MQGTVASPRTSPIMFGGGTGSEVMHRIAAPMVGGMVTAPLLSMFVVPALYRLMRSRRSSARRDASSGAVETGAPSRRVPTGA